LNHRASIVSVFVMCLFATSSVFAQSDSATLVSSQGQVEITLDKKGVTGQYPLPIPEGAHIKTGADSSAILVLANGSKIELSANTHFTYASQTSADTNLFLLSGRLTGWIRHMNKRRLNIRTPSAVAAVRGTVLSASVNGETSLFDLYQGTLFVTDKFGQSTTMTEGQRSEVNTVHGLIGTSSMPPNTRAPIEPETPPILAPRADSSRPKNPQPPATIPSEPNTPAAELTNSPPPPNPQQETKVGPPPVVSPSAPTAGH